MDLRVLGIFLEPLSQTSQFKVCLHLTTGSGTDNLMGHLSGCRIVDSIEDLSLFDFYCAEAGSSWGIYGFF